MPDWKEVSPYTGQEIEEDAPANSVAGGGVSMPPDAVHQKKKKTLIDGRTKAYKMHRRKLEASRENRLNNKSRTYVESMLNRMKEFSSDEEL